MKKVFLLLLMFFSTTSVWCLTYYSKSSATDFTSTASWGNVADVYAYLGALSLNSMLYL